MPRKLLQLNYHEAEYLVFGLRIRSAWELPGAMFLADSPGEDCDVVLRRGSVIADCIHTEEGEGWYRFEDRVHTHYWPRVGTFRVVDGNEVIVDPAPDAALGVVEHVLLGPVMASVLLLRGILPLHASANRVADRVIAMVGRSGRGKSTLAAALQAAGCPIHSDDILAVPISAMRPHVPRGSVRAGLRTDVLAELGEDVSTLVQTFSGSNKYAVVPPSWDPSRVPRDPDSTTGVVKRAGDPGNRPLCGVYRIVDSDDCSIERVDPRRATLDLYVNVFRVEVCQHALPPGHLLQMCAVLASAVPVYEFRRPRDLSKLHVVARRLREHVMMSTG